MDRVILHAGMHKTGSTSIQKALQGYRDKKFEYAPLPAVVDSKEATPYNHSLFISASFDNNCKAIPELSSRGLDELEIKEAGEKCRAELAHYLGATQAETVIISAESVTNFDLGSTQSLFEFLQKYTNRIEIKAYVRDPFDYVKSVTQEVIKAGFAGEEPAPLSFRQNFESLETVFGRENISYRIFRKEELVNADAASDFWSWIELRDTPPSQCELNSSISTESAKCLLTLNNRFPIHHGSEVLYASRQELIRSLERIFPGKFEIPNHIIAKQIDLWDLAWMEKRLHQRLNIPEHSDEHLDIAGFKDWMDKISIGMIRGVSEELVARGAAVSQSATFADLVEQLYLECIRTVSMAEIDYRRFSAERYLKKYPDVQQAALDPFRHYAQWGFHEGRSDTWD